MDNRGVENTTASPGAVNLQRRRAEEEKEKKQLARELGSLCVSQYNLPIYKDLKKKKQPTEDPDPNVPNVPNVETNANERRKIMMRAELAKRVAAERAMTQAAASSGQMNEGLTRHLDNQEEGLLSTVASFLVQAFHFWFRFFPPLMLLRWSVDIALAWTEFALALANDFFRSGPVTAGLKLVQASDTPATEKKRPAAQVPSQAEMEPGTSARTLRRSQSSEDRFLFVSLFDIVKYFTTLTYFMCKLFDVFIIIPLLSYQLCFLEMCSNALHRLAGLDTDENSRNLPENGTLQTPPKVNMASAKTWQADQVVNKLMAQLQDIPIVGLFLETFGVERHPSVFRKMQKSIRQNMHSMKQNAPANSLTQRFLTALYEFNRLVEKASYRNVDPIYNEDWDPDYEPEDTSEDSLEYADDDDLDASRNDGCETGDRKNRNM